MRNFDSLIISWYGNNKRDLPWRNTNNPYFIWISEIILQQTRVNQGINYYLNFVNNFPTITSLSQAPEDDVLKLWQGLGYYSRARNLHFAAKQVVNEHNGIFPSDYKQILKLKGIGNYTAAAIASIAFNQPYPVLDGNVYRVLSRIFCIKSPINNAISAKEYTQLAFQLLNRKNPGIYNQSIMELGALICKPINPTCHLCPVQIHCKAFSQNNIHLYPVKIVKNKVTKRYFHYLIIYSNHQVILKKRSENDIWKGLYDFPTIETIEKTSHEKLLTEMIPALFGKNKIIINSISKTYIHKLTHQTIFATFFLIKTSSFSEEFLKEGFLVNINKIDAFPIPKLIEKFLILKKWLKEIK